MLSEKVLKRVEGDLHLTTDWWCSDCSRHHTNKDFHCMCGQCRPDGREDIPKLVHEIRMLKRRIWRMEKRARRGKPTWPQPWPTSKELEG